MNGGNVVEPTEGHMYRVVDGEVFEFVRFGGEILRVDDPKLHECIGQLTLELAYGGDDDEEETN